MKYRHDVGFLLISCFNLIISHIVVWHLSFLFILVLPPLLLCSDELRHWQVQCTCKPLMVLFFADFDTLVSWETEIWGFHLPVYCFTVLNNTEIADRHQKFCVKKAQTKEAFVNPTLQRSFWSCFGFCHILQKGSRDPQRNTQERNATSSKRATGFTTVFPLHGMCHDQGIKSGFT